LKESLEEALKELEKNKDSRRGNLFPPKLIFHGMIIMTTEKIGEETMIDLTVPELKAIFNHPVFQNVLYGLRN